MAIESEAQIEELAKLIIASSALQEYRYLTTKEDMKPEEAVRAITVTSYAIARHCAEHWQYAQQSTAS